MVLLNGPFFACCMICITHMLQAAADMMAALISQSAGASVCWFVCYFQIFYVHIFLYTCIRVPLQFAPASYPSFSISSFIPPLQSSFGHCRLEGVRQCVYLQGISSAFSEKGAQIAFRIRWLSLTFWAGADDVRLGRVEHSACCSKDYGLDVFCCLLFLYLCVKLPLRCTSTTAAQLMYLRLFYLPQNQAAFINRDWLFE